MQQPIYRFAPGFAEGSSSLKDLLGGKGAFLAWMCDHGAPVPPGFTITTAICKMYQQNPSEVMQAVIDSIPKHMEWLESQMGFMPLVSVRSGAPVSMPGMMDTILNVGLTSKNIDEWAERIGFTAAYDSLYRLRVMYGNVVYGIPRDDLEFGPDVDKSKMTDKHWEQVFAEQDKIYASVDCIFPDNLSMQLMGAVKAVFDSWNTPRAIEYRNQNGLSHDMGTAVNIQAMVFGNMNDQSATGVLFTRNPQTGEDKIMGEYLINAQGEDVVAGIVTPQPITDLQVDFPKQYDQLQTLADKFEMAFADAQDIEFTIQDGELYLLQTRTAKRSARAAIKIAWDMYSSKVISFEQMLKRITPKQFVQASKPIIDEKNNHAHLLGTGLPVCDGVVSGVIALSSDNAVARAKDGQKVILVGKETTPDDIAGMGASIGILTATGGATSHAAVVSRGMEKPCVVGFGGMEVTNGGMKIGNQTFSAGMTISICGSSGRVFYGEVPTIGGSVFPEADNIVNLIAKQNGVMLVDTEFKAGRRVIAADWMMKGRTPTTTVQELSKIKLKEQAIIDLTPPNELFEPADVNILTCVGDVDYTSKVQSFAQALLDNPLQNVQLVLPECIDKKMRDKLSKAGYQLVCKIDTIDDLINAKGAVEPNENLKKAIGSPDAWAKVVAGLEALGVNMVEVPSSMPVGELLGKFLKEAA